MRTHAVTALALFSLCPLAAEEPARKRIAVFDFDNAGVQTAATPIFFTSTAPNLGKAAADLLINRLVKNASVSVIERAAIDKLLAEQNLSNSDRTDPVTAAKLGRILGVDAIVLGTITHYDYDDKTTGGGGGARARFGLGGSSMTTKHDIQARVQISGRIVSPDTAEVLAAAEGRGEITRKGVKVDVRDMGRLQMGGSSVATPVMNEAMDQSIAQLAAELEQRFAKLPARTPVIEGLVADASQPARLVLNVGSRHGVRAGDRLEVWRTGKEIRDPATGKVLLRDDTLLGEARVTTVNENSAFAAYQGSAAVQTGDLVKSPRKQP